MHIVHTILENETLKLLEDFNAQTGHVISA